MRLIPTGGFDLATGALVVGGAVLVAASLVTAVVLFAPAEPESLTAEPTPTSVSVMARPLTVLAPDRVATVLSVDLAIGAGAAAQAGDRDDVLGYYSRQATGAASVTRLLLQDVPVLAVARSGANAALTLAVPHDGAILLQEAQALGGKPFVSLRPVPPAAGPAATSPASFSDVDLALRLAGGR
jgi:Flp pilus assembly protein CpaB